MSAALACSGCAFGDEVRWAYVAATLLLLAVPVVLVGAVAAWLRRAGALEAPDRP